MLDSIFSGFVKGGYGSEYSKHFTSNKLTQKQIDDYNLEELFRRQKIEVDAQFKKWDGTHIPTTKYIKSRIVSAAYIQMEVKKPPIVKNKDDYVSKAIEIANDENILDRKKYYQQTANEKLFNTEDVGEKFNSILKKLF